MGRDREEGQHQPTQQEVIKTEANVEKEGINIEVLEVVCTAGGGGGQVGMDEGGGGGGGVAGVAISQPSQKPEAPPSSVGGGGGGGGGNPKKRLRTATVLEEVDKKFLLEQYVSERQKNVNLQLQNRVSQLEREMREMERLSTEKEKVHLETLALAENHHRENVLAEIGRLLEAEFNCSICNEVFIEPAVLNCGHTYCSYCINRALQTDFLCPVCRTGYNFNPPAKNIEMRNFINKIFQMLPEEVKTTRDQVLQERAALPMPDANASNNRNRTRRRRSRSVSPFDLFGMFNDDDAFRERRSRSRSASVSTLSNSDDSDDDSAISFFDLRASPRSPSPELRPLRSRTRSRSPTGGTRRRRSPSRYAGLMPLGWRSPLWGSPPTRASTSSRYANVAPANQPPEDRPDRGDRRQRQVARRGRAFSTGRSYSGTVSGPRRYGWGPPRRQIHSSANRGDNNNPNNDNPSSSGNITGTGQDSGNLMRRRMSVGFSPYRSLAARSSRWGAFGPTRGDSASNALRVPLLTPRIARVRSLALSDNFEDLFSRRDPAPTPAVGSGGSSEPTTTQPLLNHDHSYTSNTASAIAAALAAARTRASAIMATPNSQPGSITENTSAALMSGIERLQEQTRRLYAATNIVAVTRGGTGHLSQALALLAPPSASDNNNVTGNSATSRGMVDSASSNTISASNTNTLALVDAEPRRSPRIARQSFRHRFLTPTTTNSMYRESERDRDLDMRERDRGEPSNNSSQNLSLSQSQGSSTSQGQGSQGQSQNYSQESQSGGAGSGGTERTESITSSTGGTRGSSVGDSPTSSEIDALPPVAPIDNAGLSAMRRFVHDLHNYRSSAARPEGRDRDRGDRDRADRGDNRDRGERDSRRNAAGVSGSSRSTRDNRPRSGRRSSVEFLEEMELF